MKIERRLPRIRSVDVHTPQGDAGMLGNEQGSYLFSYRPDASELQQISLLMPWRLSPYTGGLLPPVFSMNLPEGYLLEHIRFRLAKVARIDPLLLLAITGDAHPIGRLTVSSRALEDLLPGRSGADAGERLQDILAWDGTEDLFTELLERYVFRSGISGVQPKVVVPERARAFTPDLIVKSGRTEYPHLALNEFVCMTIAREAGMQVPDFWLSDNRELFVMRRFDSTPEGSRLGFEDFAVLTGRQPEHKYEGSYEMVARAIRSFVASNLITSALAQLFDTVALSCAVGNGDAHLKNFGVLYTHPAHDDVRLAPVYDIVNTTMYLPADSLALSLSRRKSRDFAGRYRLLAFASTCGIEDADARLDRIQDAMVRTMETHEALIREAPGLREALDQGLGRIEARTTQDPAPAG